VIAVHISMHFTLIPAVNLPGLLNLFVYITAHFAVPVFIFISGWVLAVRYSGAYSVPAYYQRRARTILPPVPLLYRPLPPHTGGGRDTRRQSA